MKSLSPFFKYFDRYHKKRFYSSLYIIHFTSHLETFSFDAYEL